MTEPHNIHEVLKASSSFIGNFAAFMYSRGATTDGIEKSICRIAQAWNIHAEFSILPAEVIINLWDETREHSYNTVVRVPEGAIDYQSVAYLTRLSFMIADRHLTVEDACAMMTRILAMKRIAGWKVLLLAGAANASFCRLFGGDTVSMAIVFVATVCGFFLKRKFSSAGIDYRVVTLLAAFVAAVISSSGFVFGWGTTPETALGTGVLFLVPGIPFSNSVNDLLKGRYICSLSRFLQAMMIVVSLSLGLILAFFILNIKFY